MNRRDLLGQLKTLLSATSGVTTVVRSYMGMDMSQYTEAQLPLIDILEPVENVQTQLVGRRQMISLSTELKVWFVSWAESPTSTYEALVKNIRDKIASDFTLSCNATGVWITSVSQIQGTLPVYWFAIGLATRYYLSEENT